MTLRRITAVLFTVPLAACVAGGDPPARADEREVRAAIAAYDSAWLAKDVAAIERILSPDYLYFTSLGGLNDRAGTLEFLADTGYTLTLSRRTEMHLTLAGPVARMRSRWEGEGRYRGQAVLDDQTCGQIWLRGAGGWLLFSEHCANRQRPDSGSGSAD